MVLAPSKVVARRGAKRDAPFWLSEHYPSARGKKGRVPFLLSGSVLGFSLKRLRFILLDKLIILRLECLSAMPMRYFTELE